MSGHRSSSKLVSGSSADFSPKTTILYDVILPRTTRQEAKSRIAESENLLHNCDRIAKLKIIQRRHHPSNTSYIGREKLKEIGEEAQQLKANLLIVNDSLKPKQIYSIENFFERLQHKIEIWDRIYLIIEIFSRHARTAESKLQLELAKLNYLGPRIYGMGDDLSQQGGGIGTRGIGETNTEIMKRHISQRKKLIKKKVKKLQYSRRMIRTRRHKNGLKMVSIIGYTNAGKSQLFEALTKRSVPVQDKLFVTLDTTTSRLYLNQSRKTILLSDTIGFISRLPYQLLDAFKSTLEETIHADLLLHVVDLSDPEYPEKMATVRSILSDLNQTQTPVITLFNKVDLVKQYDQDIIDHYQGVVISAKKKLGLENLKDKLSNHFFTDPVPLQPL